MLVQTLISSRGTPLFVYRKGSTRSEEIKFLRCHYKPGTEFWGLSLRAVAQLETDQQRASRMLRDLKHVA